MSDHIQEEVRICIRCQEAAVSSSNSGSLVLVQLKPGGPLHWWHRSDFASIYMLHHTTLCNRTVLLSATSVESIDL